LKRIRSFIALNLDDDVKKRIYIISEKFKNLKGLKLVEYENLHITLKFLGDIDPVQQHEIIKALENACKDINEITIKVNKMGAFPNLRNPRVVWLGIEPNPKINKLHENIENNLCNIGFEKDGKKFHPHITIGRNKTNHNNKLIKKKIVNTEDFEILSVITKVSFIKSTLTPKGPVYDIIKDIKLT